MAIYRFVKRDSGDDRDIGAEIEDANRSFVAKFPGCAALVVDYCRRVDERDWVEIDFEATAGSNTYCMTWYTVELARRGIVLVHPEGFQLAQAGEASANRSTSSLVAMGQRQAVH